MSDDDDRDPSNPGEPHDSQVGTDIVDDEPTDPGNPYDALPRGTTLGRYAILGRLDESEADVMYAAFDANSQQKVAVKLLRVTVTEDDTDREHALLRIAGEAQRISKIDHPCVVRVYEVGVFQDRVFMAMEFIDGIDLGSWMEARDDPFPWPEVVRVFREAGRGLAAAHKGGVIHRDFKPANVILGKSGRICVLDFGLSRVTVKSGKDDAHIDELRSSFPGELVAADESSASMSLTGMSLGTPGYMAPEQHVSGKVDARSDQFSFCVALYEALYGERPFSGNRPIALALEAVNRKFRDAPDDSDVPEWLRAVVLKGLAPLPEDRHESMEALLRELAADPKASRRRWALGGVGVAVGLAAVVGMMRLREAEKSACARNVEALTGIWDPARREALAASMTASQRPWAEQTWNTVEDRVDAWTDVWTGGTELACLATRAWGVASEKIYERRRQCLDRHLAELAAVSRVLEAPTADIVDHAHEVAMALRSPRLCRDDDTLMRRPVPPEALEDRMPALRAEVEDVRAYLAAGQLDVALRQAEELDRSLEPLGHPPLHVEIVVMLGQILRAKGLNGPAQAQLHRAAVLASTAGLEPDLATAYVELAAVLATSGKAEEAARYSDHAEALAQRLQLGHLRPRLAATQAEIALHQGKPSVALSKLYRAIKLERDRVDAHPLRQAPLWMRLGRLLIERGDPQTAETHFEDARRILERALGPQHPLVADALVDLAVAQRQLDRDADAIAGLQRALEVRKQLEDPAATADVALQLAQALLDTGRASESLSLYADAEAGFERASRPVLVAQAVYGRGLAEIADGADGAAAQTLARAVTLLERLPNPVATANARFALARALWPDPAEHTRALALAGLAQQTFDDAGSEHVAARDAVRTWAAEQTQRIDINPDGKREPSPTPSQAKPATDSDAATATPDTNPAESEPSALDQAPR